MFAFVQSKNSAFEKLNARANSAVAPFGNHTIETFSSGSSRVLIAKTHAAAGRHSESYFEAPDGSCAVFDGWLDNRKELAAELDLPAVSDPAEVYYHAARVWGDQADLRAIGHYASVVCQPDGSARLARSPIGARPLHWAWIDGSLVIASLPRLLNAIGLPMKLSQQTLADSMFLNTTDPHGWLENSWRLGVGEIAQVARANKTPKPIKYWHPERISQQQSGTSRDHIETTEALLQQAIQLCLTDTAAPGMLLSAGLDSSNVASRAMEILEPDKTLPSFTFVPTAIWQGDEPHWGYGDEAGRVKAFAQMHPSLRPHFIANEDRQFDSEWEQVFAAIGCAPPGLTNIWMYHGLYAAARAQGCDRLLSAEYGNQSFSIAADWAVAELVRRGKWRAAWRAIAGDKTAITPKWRRFLRSGFAANLPDWLWRAWQAVKGRAVETPNAAIAALNPSALTKHQVHQRAEAAKILTTRNFPATRAEWIRDIFARGDMGSGEIELAFEQIYGITSRDPAAYRPLIEHCLSLPTDMFLRDGEDRWLAREMSRGHLPEAQRTEQKAGMHQADWHERMTPEIPRIRAELEAASKRPELRELFDFDELRERLDEWPEEPNLDDVTTYRLIMGIPIALMTARFVRHSYGWNE